MLANSVGSRTDLPGKERDLAASLPVLGAKMAGSIPRTLFTEMYLSARREHVWSEAFGNRESEIGLMCSMLGSRVT